MTGQSSFALPSFWVYDRDYASRAVEALIVEIAGLRLQLRNVLVRTEETLTATDQAYQLASAYEQAQLIADAHAAALICDAHQRAREAAGYRGEQNQ